jgi:hypothetical protein
MTIASLDREMFEGEQRPSPKSCREPVKTGGASGVAVSSRTRRNLVGDTPQPQQFPAILSVLFQLVRIRGTLLHEMIPCSDESLMGEIGVHDPDGSAGIFSWDAQRTKVFVERATALRNAFFSFKR